MYIYQGFRDTNIGQRIIGDLYSKNFTLSIGNSDTVQIQSTDTQIMYKPRAHSHNKTKSFIVLYCYNFQSLFTFFNICTQNFTLSISPRSIAYSCFISESLLYYHWSRQSINLSKSHKKIFLLCFDFITIINIYKYMLKIIFCHSFVSF